MKLGLNLMVLSLCTGIVGCAGPQADDLPRGASAYKLIPPSASNTETDSYLIGPRDLLSLAVVEEPDLTIEKLSVDYAGRVQIPLIGSIKISGLSPDQASQLIANKLKEKYIRDPRVSINVTEPAERLVSVEGQVNKAGAYPVTPETTLLSAVSMAESPTRIARLTDIVVFRTVDGNRMAARFNLNRIRAGLDPDPRILGGDAIVVGFSSTKSAYRDLLQAAPLFNVFTRL
ncbi:polysaccharide biosynthesis/export family protein [Novosphingobium sp. FKTRR1]|uniref:polysaccharide biosynthesis/export family protein n=1 Tax=Novosphingobium sp. FKTRR1 TaxID=2879118 RepID=UPI001CF02241|nr:polysaccharide biosynthesis/export family protein [Novosphingobium sp. FKTRR1]